MKKTCALLLLILVIAGMAFVSCKQEVAEPETIQERLAGVWECSYTGGNGISYKAVIVGGEDQSFSFKQEASISDVNAFRNYVKMTENLSEEEADALSYPELLAYVTHFDQSNYGHFLFTDTYVIATTFDYPVIELTFILTADGFLYCRETGLYYSKKS